ncbi:hypothetical protein Taro_033288, partial [Colocasia esculenta]|nr:hypothetical protein [Colocasia esculenta]
GALGRHPAVVLVTLSLVPSLVALAGVVPGPCGVSGVQGGSSCRPSTWWRFEVAVVVLLSHVFDSAGFTGVVFGLTRVVVEAFTMFPLLSSTLQ